MCKFCWPQNLYEGFSQTIAFLITFSVSVLFFFHTDLDEMIYDDVELGEEGGCNSSLDNGWSSSEFESYDEASDGEGRPENGMPHAFMRGKPPQRKTHVCITITLPFLCQHYSQQTTLLLQYNVHL